MKISYSIVLYNNTKNQIRRLYKNILEETPKNMEYELYFIDNSTNKTETKEVLKSIRTNDRNVHVLFTVNNIGFGVGHNLAIKRVNSDYHIIVNPDIRIPTGGQITKIILHMNQKKIVLVSPLIKFPNGKVQALVKRTPTVLDLLIRFIGGEMFKKRQDWFTYQPDGYEFEHIANNFPGSFLVFRTDILKRIGGFDERYFLYMEDSDISRSMAKHGKAVFYPDAYVYHEWQRENKKTLRGIVRMSVSVVKYFNKWGWKFW